MIMIKTDRDIGRFLHLVSDRPGAHKIRSKPNYRHKSLPQIMHYNQSIKKAAHIGLALN